MRLTTESVLPRKRLLRVDLLTWCFLATTTILRSSAERENVIASSVGATVDKSSHEEVFLLMCPLTCIQWGCAPTSVSFYISSNLSYVHIGELSVELFEHLPYSPQTVDTHYVVYGIDCWTKACRPPRSHARYKAVDGPGVTGMTLHSRTSSIITS